MTKTIQLAKPFTINKLGNMCYLSEKLDGVPVRFDFNVSPFGDYVSLSTMRTRQDQNPGSCQIVLGQLTKRLNNWFETRPQEIKQKWASSRITLVAEITHEDYTDFKDVSGVVRRDTPQSGLIANIFDFNANVDKFPKDFARRYYMLQQIIPMQTNNVRVVHQFPVQRDMVEGVFEAFMREKPHAEGMIVRDADGEFQPGKRTWCYQKLLRKPTIDLNVVGFEEAVSEAGEPKGMVGRVLVSYKGKEIGCGPGKLTHAERTELWDEWTHWQAAIKSGYKETPWRRMACIQYKEDKSYEALREPTFQYWRDDKDTPDA